MSSRFSPGVADEIADLIRAGATIVDAAREVGVPHETVRTWLRKGRKGVAMYEPFWAAVEAAREAAAARPMTAAELELCLARAIRLGSVQGMRLWTEREEARREREREPDRLDVLREQRRARLERLAREHGPEPWRSWAANGDGPASHHDEQEESG